MDKSASSRQNQLVRKFYAPLGWAYDNTPLRNKPLGKVSPFVGTRVFFDKNGDPPPRI